MKIRLMISVFIFTTSFSHIREAFYVQYVGQQNLAKPLKQSH